jgi:hypothetical protein
MHSKPDHPPRWRKATFAALLLGCVSLAHGAPDDQACGPEGCSAGRIDPAAIREAVREAARSSAGAPDRRRAADSTRLPAAAPSDPASVWERRLGGPGEREDYNCALSFGVGGTLAGDRFLATRLLGRTRVLRDQ